MVGPEAVPELMGQGQDGLIDCPLLAVVQESHEARVLTRPAQGPQAGQARGAVMKIPAKYLSMCRVQNFYLSPQKFRFTFPFVKTLQTLVKSCLVKILNHQLNGLN